jgi:hypothetical protein
LQEARQAYNIQLQKGKELGFEEAAQAEPVRRSENDKHDIEELETVDATVPQRSVDPTCIAKLLVRRVCTCWLLNHFKTPSLTPTEL